MFKAEFIYWDWRFFQSAYFIIVGINTHTVKNFINSCYLRNHTNLANGYENEKILRIYGMNSFISICISC